MSGTYMDQPFVFPDECSRAPITLEIRAEEKLGVVLARVRSRHVPLEVVIASERFPIRAAAHSAH